MIRILILILISLLLRPTDLKAEEGIASLLRNDKEATSHVYTRAEQRGSTRRIGRYSEIAFIAMTGGFETLRLENRLCGASLIEEWRKRLGQASLPAYADNMLDYLILWRSENRIDDILLKILESDLGWYQTPHAPGHSLPRVRERDARRAAEYLERENLKNTDLPALFNPFKGKSPEEPGCTLTEFRRLVAKYREVTLLVTAGRKQGILDEGTAKLLLHYDQAGIDPNGIALEQYLDSLRRVKNREKSHSGTSRFLSEIPKDTGGLTRRERLYRLYDPTQIRMLTTVMKRLFTRMDSTRADLVFTRPDGSTEIVPISPMGQYYFARKLLKRDLDELSRSFFFQGRSPGYDDLLTASLETGLIAPTDLDPLLEVDDLWNPDVPKWKRASDLAFRITGSASLFLPPPYNTLTSVTLVLLNSFIERKTRKPDQGDPGYDPF